MADKIIIVGVKRGNAYIPISEITQMIGRSGRKHSSDAALAEIVVDESDELYLLDGLENSKSLAVDSDLNNVDSLCFHVLPSIVSGGIRGLGDVEKWFERSLAYMQGTSVDFIDLLDSLEEFEVISRDGDSIMPTALGKACSSYYFHPADALAWKMNFQELFDSGLEYDDIALAWALGNVPYGRAIGDMRDDKGVMHRFFDNLPHGLDVMDGARINVVLWWYLLDGPPIGLLKSSALSMKKDFGRLSSFLRVLSDSVAGWDRRDFFDDLDFKIKNRIPSDLINLCKLDGISKSRARFLNEIGIECLDDIIEKTDMICDHIGDDEIFKMLIYRLGSGRV